MGPLGELGALFNPGMRHEEEEKRAKHMLREEEGTGRKGRLGIDLESGVVVIGSDRAAGEKPSTGADEPGTARPSDAGTRRDGDAQRNGATAAGAAEPDTNVGRNGSGTADRSNGRAAKPGEPQVAHRSPGAAPEGKARRRAGTGSVVGGASSPVGKSRRTQK